MNLMMKLWVAGHSKPLSLDLALPLIKQKMGQSSYHPINALKEAAEKQKVTCRHVEKPVQQIVGAPPIFGYQIFWEGQVSIAFCSPQQDWHPNMLQVKDSTPHVMKSSGCVIAIGLVCHIAANLVT